MTFKVGEGQLLNQEPNTGNTPARSNTTGPPNPTETTNNRPLGNDLTPTRHRELETFGNNTRSRVEGFSNGNGNGNGNGNAYGHRRHNSGHPGNSNSSGPDGGLGIRLGAEVLGLDLDANLQLNSLRDGGPSLNLRAENLDVRLGNEARRGNDFRPGNDVRPANEFRPTNDVRPPNDFRPANDVRPANEFRPTNDVRPANEFRPTSDVRPANEFRPTHDVRPPIDFRPTNDFRPGNDFRAETNVRAPNEFPASTDPRQRNDIRHDFRHPYHDGFQSNRSNEGHGRADRFLRETIGTLRHELNSLRVELNRGPDHRQLGFNERHIERILQFATRGFEDRLGLGERPDRIAWQIRSEISNVVRFENHFSRLERVGGEPVRRAYESVLNFVLNRPEDANRLPWLPEVLRDLRAGAFLHPHDLEGPYPLTGRARIVSEMMALMRTLEAIERFIAETKVDPFAKFLGDWSAFSFGRMPGVIGAEALEALAKALANSGPTLPGMAGRMEMLRLVAALNGVLMDAAGRPLVMADGMPLKLGELLWFNGRAPMLDLWSGGDRFSSRFLPTVMHGFDAVYSLMGFDGRSLSLPHFIAIQSQINASEFEWFFGAETQRERWLRAAIEFLKDSISFDHNVLGEMLEEAVTNDRFHYAVMRGTVEDGTPVSGSFSFAPAPVQ